MRELVVGGLRAYGPKPTRVPLAPLTLVFGPNSAGKSSLLSTLTLLAQSVTPNPTRVLVMAGPLVDAGSFRMAVHNHDETSPMTLGLVTSPVDADGERAAPVEVVASYTWNPVMRTPEATGLSFGPVDAPARLALPMDPVDAEGVERRDRAVAVLQDVLERIAYLGPMRARPERTHAVGFGRTTYVGPEGEALAEVLDARPDLVDDVNRWTDLLVHTVRERNNQVLVETHSEHLVLRLLRRVREGALASGDVAILYVEQHEDGAAFVRRLDVDEDGELAGGWPGDFFSERLDEVFGGLA